MLSSLRRRILIVVAIAVVGAVGAIIGLRQYARTTTEQRVARAHENVGLEVERLTQMFANAPTNETRRRGRRDFGPLKSGFLNESLEDEAGPPPFGSIPKEARAETARQAKARGGVVLRETTNANGQPIVVAVAPLGSGGYVWAATLVGAGGDNQRLRAIVLFLTLASALLVVASLHTLVVFQREARSLRASLRTLGDDLTARVAKPRLQELREIADGVEELALDLVAAQHDKERLTQELARKERLAALGRVAAGVAHEVRNPLAAMKLRADLALESPSLEPALAADLGDISREIARLDRFVKDLLVVAGRKDPMRTDTDLGALARARADLLAPWAKERGVAIEVAGDARAAVEEDSLARALDNLLRNAIEAAPSASTVTVDVARGAGEARVTVADAGPGVDAARGEQLFEPFFTTKPDGTGLGLALSRAVAAAHGGTLTYAREADRTRFTLSIRE